MVSFMTFKVEIDELDRVHRENIRILSMRIGDTMSVPNESQHSSQ